MYGIDDLVTHPDFSGKWPVIFYRDITECHCLDLRFAPSDYLGLPALLDLNASMESPKQGRKITTNDATPAPYTSQFPNAPVDLLQHFCNVTTVAIVFLDHEYRITFLNPRAWEMIWPRTDVLGTCLFESYPCMAREDQPYLENYRRCMEQGIPGLFEAFYGDPLNMWLRVHCYPSDDGIVLLFSDFTQEKTVREELRERRETAEHQRNEIDTLYRTAPIGLALFDPRDFRSLRLNDRQAEFFGMTPDQMLGRPITEIAPIEGLREVLERVLRGEEVRDHLLEGELVTTPGTHRYWLVSCFPLFGWTKRLERSAQRGSKSPIRRRLKTL
jgi:PAS domain-containing protein